MKRLKKSGLEKSLGDVGYLRGIGGISHSEAGVIKSVILSLHAAACEDQRREARERQSGKKEPKQSA